MSSPSMDVDYLRFVLHEETDEILTSRRRSPSLTIDLPDLRELRALLGILIDRGIEKVRLTGDDPGLRSDLADVVAFVARFDGVNEVAMTTRGIGLAGRVGSLVKEGLNSINFNIDTLQPERYAKLTGADQFDGVWGAVEEALSNGLSVKLNVVLRRGVNDDEIDAFVELAEKHPLQVRFVEWNADTDTIAPPQDFIPTWDTMAAIRLPMMPAVSQPNSGPARIYDVTEGKGSVGFISNVSDHFCLDCKRIGLTDFGEITSCIFGHGLSLLGYLRSKDGEVGVSAFIDRVLRRKSLLAAKLSPLQAVVAPAAGAAATGPAPPAAGPASPAAGAAPPQ